MSGTLEGTFGRSSRIAPLPLQFRQAPSGLEIWAASQDTSAVDWVDQPTSEVKRNLLREGAFSGVEECPIRALRLGHGCQLDGSGNTSGG